MKRLLPLLALLLVSISFAQVNVEWERTFGGAGADAALSVLQTTDGGYIIAGITTSFGMGYDDAWLIKTDSGGNMLWNRTFGGSGVDTALSVQQTSEGGYVFVGTTSSVIKDEQEMWMVKTNAGGVEQWNRTFGVKGYDGASSVQQTSDGGYIVVGYTYPIGAYHDAWLIKTNHNGDAEWNRTFGGVASDYAFSVRQTSDGGYIIAGGSGSFGSGTDVWLIKTDSGGNMLWNRTYGGADMDIAYSMDQTSDGGYVLLGTTASFGMGGSDFWLLRTGSDGSVRWNRTFGGNGNESCPCQIMQTSDGGYVFAGTATSVGTWSDGIIIKIDTEGKMQWNRTLGGTKRDVAASVQQTSDGGYIVAGYTESQGVGNGDFWLVKLAPEGAAPQQPQPAAQGVSCDKALANYAACVILEAAMKKDVGICDHLEPVLKDGCVLAVAVAKKDVALCDTLSEVSKMSAQDVICKAMVTLDTKYCDEIKTAFGYGDETFRASCYSMVAVGRKDSSICEKITIDWMKKGCYEGVANATKTGAPAGCSTDRECGDNVCVDGKCVEPKLTFLFVPVNWKTAMQDFDSKVGERIGLFLNATPLKDCRGKVKVIKSHENCKIVHAPHWTLSWIDLAQIKACAMRTSTNYDYIVGLTEDELPGMGGVTFRLAKISMANTKRLHNVAHEIGHLFGLSEEYCNYWLLPSKCGFKARENPLKSEYGCREKDSTYDNDEFPDCCVSNKYADDGCKGNVGLSESSLAKEVYETGVYDAVDEIYGNNNHLYDNIGECRTNDSKKEGLKSALETLERGIDNFSKAKKTLGFNTGNVMVEDSLKQLKEYEECLGEEDFCGCLDPPYKNTRSILSNIRLLSQSQYAMYNFVEFDRYSMMSTAVGKKGEPVEFSKPAYDYLSTLPEMGCD